MKRMLINATQQEELRMAMVDGQRLFDLNIELPASERKKANIYKGKITRIEPSLEAAFVDYGADRHGFLPLKEVSSEYFIRDVESGSRTNIRDVLKEGQDIVVQIDKEERGNKGAALTTFVSLAGRFVVLKPNKPRSGGVSRRISGTDRDDARESLSSIQIPDGMSVILRTAGIDRNPEELAWDLENLLTIWHAILNVVLERPSPFLIYRESNSVVRALRDYLTTDIGEILIDDEQTFKEAIEFVEQVMPQNLKKLKHYTDPVPLFTRFQIESQIESAFTHSVNLPSGGSVVIDHTEALVSIDINSARATKGGDIEATALNTNLEAADEIARQLRIRDLGGLIVIDFIDMGPPKHQRDVENRLRDAVRQDRARVQIGKISRFGLLEMSRQRLRPSLGESSYLTCPRCSGIGTIRSVESLALAILRIIGEEARKERTAKVIAQLPVEVATYLLNEKRDWVHSLESRNEIQIVLVANPALETPHYDIRRVRDDQTDLPENTGTSYSFAAKAPEPEAPQAILERKAVEPAAVAVLKPSKPAPAAKEEKSPGLFSRIFALFSGGEDRESSRKKPSRRRKAASTESRSRGQQQRSRRQRDGQVQDNRGPKQSKPAPKRAKDARKQPADKPEKSKQSAAAPAAPSSAPQEGERKSERQQTARSRRSRGGRRRKRGAGERKEGASAAASVTEPTAADSLADTSRPEPVAAAPSRPEPVAAAPSLPVVRPPELESPLESSRPSAGNGAPAQEPQREARAEPVSPPAEPRKVPDASPEVPSEARMAPRADPEARPPAIEAVAPKPTGRLLPWEPAEPVAPPPKATEGNKPEATDS